MRLCCVLCATLLSCHVPVAAGDLVTDEIDSKAIARKVKVNVLLPDGYATDVERRYPTVYLLHGLGGDFSEWQRVGVVDEAKGLPVIVAMPEGDQSFYVNHHENAEARWDDYITSELIAHVDGKYRTVARREARAVSGLSMGGFGAVALGFKHPELFASVASHSGAVGILERTREGRTGDRIREIFGPDDSEARKAYNPLALAKGLAAENRPSLYIDCGSADFLLESNRDFVRELAKLRFEYEYREVPGGHDFAYWKRNVRYSLSRQIEALERAAKAMSEKPAAVAALGAPVGAPVGAASVEAVIGEWDFVVKYNDDAPSDYTLKIRRDGDKLAGVLVSPRSGEHAIRSVSVADGKLKLVVERNFEGTEVTFEYEGRPAAAGLEGTGMVKGFEEQLRITWSAKRKAKVVP